MLQLQDLTVGYVSGMIAAAIFVGMFNDQLEALPVVSSFARVRIIIIGILSTTSSAIHPYGSPGHSSRTTEGGELHRHRLRSYVVRQI
jgi:hypothetical protein